MWGEGAQGLEVMESERGGGSLPSERQRLWLCISGAGGILGLMDRKTLPTYEQGGRERPGSPEANCPQGPGQAA